MSDQQQTKPKPATPRKKKQYTQEDADVLGRLMALDPTHKTFKKITIAFMAALVLFIVTLSVINAYFIKTVKEMHIQYINDTEQIIITKSEIEASNSWERLPLNERKERLRSQYCDIVRYYTNKSAADEKMDDQMIQDSFNQVWDCTVGASVDFFLPVAYMKVASNFNPAYDVDYKHGLGAFLNKRGDHISKLTLIREDPSFRLEYEGIKTLDMPIEAIKLIIAKMDDLMREFNNRIEWVLLSLFTHEYDVIERYWDDGKGAIPDELRYKGNLAEAIKYFSAFRNWQIPRDSTLEDISTE